MSESLVRKLKLDLRDSHIEIKGINQQNLMKIADLEISSHFESFTTNYDVVLPITQRLCVVLPAIIQRVSNIRLNKELYGKNIIG